MMTQLAIARTDTARLREIADQIQSAQREIRSRVFTMGSLLIEARDILRSNGGRSSKGQGFGAWVKESCGLSHETACKVMRAYEVFNGIAAADHFDDSAMYLLSSPSVSIAVRKKAFTLAKAGELVTYRMARDLIRELLPSRNLETMTERVPRIETLAKDWISQGMPNDHELSKTQIGRMVMRVVESAVSSK